MAFVTIGIKLPAHVARALVTVFFGVAGFLVAWWALPDAAHSYEAFLLIIAYWVGPWLGVVFADQYLRRGPGDRRISSTTGPTPTGAAWPSS